MAAVPNPIPMVCFLRSLRVVFSFEALATVYCPSTSFATTYSVNSQVNLGLFAGFEGYDLFVGVFSQEF